MDRLKYLYNNAKEIGFDEESKLVFMSDIHRGDGTYYDSLLPNKNVYKAALNYYYKNNFIYIEVGDGDELWINRDFDIIARSYEDIFMIFNKFSNENRLYMIYGNHDIIKRKNNLYHNNNKFFRNSNNSYRREFANFIEDNKFYEALTFKYRPLDKKFLAVHGHQVDFMNSKFWLLARFLVRYIWKFMNGIASFKDSTSPAINNAKGDKIDSKLEKWSREKGKMLICGHTHISRMPKVNEPPYFNDGCCILPYAVTSIEIENGKISLIKWSIDIDDRGILYMSRKIISGPIDIGKYLIFSEDSKNI